MPAPPTSAPPKAEAAPTTSAPQKAEAPPTSLAIDFAPSDAGLAWFVSGLEDVVGNEFRRFHDVALAKKVDPTRCPGRGARCLVDQYRAARVQIVVLGELEGRDDLAYQVFDTSTGTRAFRGALRVSGVTSALLQRQIGDLVRPIVQRGGLLDERPAATPGGPPPPLATPRSPSPSRPLVEQLDLAAATLIGLVLSPLALALLLVGPRELAKRTMPASWAWSVLLLGALVPVPLVTRVLDLQRLAASLSAHPPRIMGLLSPVAAGMLWGAFVLATAVWLMAPLRGLERIRHDALWPVLRSWAALCVLRAAALFTVYAPLIVLAVRTSRAIELPERLTLAFVVPAAGLLTHFWLLSLVDNLSLYLDARLVSGLPTPRNPWHATIKRYFLGYVRRNVVEIDQKLLDETLFLPGVNEEVVCYGGGFAPPRIVVGARPLETALGELPDEEEVPDRTANADELPEGFVLPSMEPAEDLALLTRAEERRRQLTLAPARRRAHMPRLLGENATLLGWVLPQSAPRGVPLISDTQEDFGVVKRLLSEHYSAFVVDDDEVDDTDPTQKDFLFGALLRQIGVVARHDVYFATIALTWDVVSSRAGWFSHLLRAPLTLYERLLAAPAARVADAYAALNSGLHHLVQYLCFLRGTGETLLTARADVPRLAGTSRIMVTEVQRSEPSARELQDFHATPRDRVVWLASIFHGQIFRGRLRWGRVVVALAAAALAGVLAAQSISRAIAYHPIYVERMKSQAAKYAEGENAR
jgi:hypothetical protein